MPILIVFINKYFVDEKYINCNLRYWNQRAMARQNLAVLFEWSDSYNTSQPPKQLLKYYFMLFL